MEHLHKTHVCLCVFIYVIIISTHFNFQIRTSFKKELFRIKDNRMDKTTKTVS